LVRNENVSPVISFNPLVSCLIGINGVFS